MVAGIEAGDAEANDARLVEAEKLRLEDFVLT